MDNYQILDWDSGIFNTSVARLLPERANHSQLQAVLNDLRGQGVKLVYWASDSQDEASQQAASALGGFLADRKVTYLIDLSKHQPTEFSTQGVEPYRDTQPTPELTALAFESGLYSRFKMDPNITQEQFENIYRQWITNSTNKTVAKEVWVINRDNKAVGMTTLGEKSKRGDIGLLAVAPHYRGQQFGTMLVNASLAWCIEQGFNHGQVVTQKANTAACALYEKCGYASEKIENFYHFWL